MNVVRSSGKFFDLKDRFQSGLEKVEKTVYELTRDLDSLNLVLNEMLAVSGNNQAYYFIKRVSRLIRIYQLFLEKKGYDQIEFNRMFHLLDKITRDDRVEFLQSSIKNRIEKISKDFCLEAEKKNQLSFMTFTFRSVNFMVRNYPGKIFKKEGTALDYLLADGERLDIFPGYMFGVTDPDDREIFPGNLMIIKTAKGLRCFRYDTLGPVYNLSKAGFKNSLRNLPEKTGNIAHYIRRKGIRYYVINTEV